MLRGSSLHTGQKLDISAITSEQGASVGIVDEVVIRDFIDAALRRDDQLLPETRTQLAQSLGSAALVDVAAVFACFQRLNRMADGVGIALDEQMVMMTGGLRDELEIENYATAANTPEPTGLKKLRARLMQPLENLMLRAMQKGIQRAQAKRDT